MTKKSKQSHPVFNDGNIRKSHHLLRIKGNSAKEEYNDAVRQIDGMLEKWVEIYDLALKLPNTYLEIRRRYISGSSHMLSANGSSESEELVNKYLEARKIGDSYHAEGGNFDWAMKDISNSAASFITESVNQRLKKQSLIESVNKEFYEEMRNASEEERGTKKVKWVADTDGVQGERCRSK